MGDRTPTGIETVLGDIDVVSHEELQRMARVAGPCLTVLLPSVRFGPDTVGGPTRLGHRLEEAAKGLADAGVERSLAGELLAPLHALEDDAEFWQHQAQGLALFAAPGYAARFRLPIEVTEQVVVGESFRLRPLVPLLSTDGGLFLLALAQNSVRLFHATRHSIGELGLGDIPSSMAEAIPQEEMARYGQSHSTGPASTQFHGQGNEADYDKAALERFFRAVDRPLTARLGTRRDPLVLACVAYYLPIFRAVSRYPLVWPEAVEGNPEHRQVQELHDAGWSLVQGHFAERETLELDRFRAAAGTGLTLVDPGEVAVAAGEGRVDTLLLAREAPGPADEGEVDRAVVETLRYGGRVLPVHEASALATPLGALLRF
jgi:hypothetical protein